MKHSTPHFSLFTQSNAEDQPGRWRFVLRPQDNGDAIGDDLPPATTFEAGGTEDDVRGERLDLLCVVRGLEALEQPSRVTLVTSSTYVREGIRYGLDRWRRNGWRWESFGAMVPIKNQDLWQRVDTALRYHRLECRIWRFDPTHEQETPPDPKTQYELVENNKITEKTPNRQPTLAWARGRVARLYSRLIKTIMRLSASLPDRPAVTPTHSNVGWDLSHQ